MIRHLEILHFGANGILLLFENPPKRALPGVLYVLFSYGLLVCTWIFSVLFVCNFWLFLFFKQLFFIGSIFLMKHLDDVLLKKLFLSNLFLLLKFLNILLVHLSELFLLLSVLYFRFQLKR